MNCSTPRHLLHYVTRRLRLRRYLKDPGDGRQQPQIPAQTLLWALLIGQILRQSSFHALEALVRSSARRTLSIAAPFCDDTLGYFTERLDPGPTRQALLSLVRGAKRNKAFDDCRWIGLAVDGTGAGWRTNHGCNLCRPKQNAAKQILGYQHSFVMISVVGTGLSLPCDGEPYGPGDSEYAAGQRLLRRVVASVGKRLAQYVVVDGEFATAPFLHTAGELGLRVVARLKDNLPELLAAAQTAFSCWASGYGFSVWSGSRGGVGRRGFRSLGNARLGNRSGVLLSPAQAGRQGGGSLLADEFCFFHGGLTIAIPHGQKPLGDREPRFQRRQEPSRPRAHLPSSCQQSADRLASHYAGLDHRTTLPTPVSPPWQTSGAQQRPAAAVLVAQSFPTASRQQQLTSCRKNWMSPFSPSDHSPSPHPH